MSAINVDIVCSRGLIISKSSFKTSGVIGRKPWKPVASADINSFKMKWPITLLVGRSANRRRHQMLRLESGSRLRHRRCTIMNIAAAAAAANTLILSDIVVLIHLAMSLLGLYVIPSRVMIFMPSKPCPLSCVRRTYPGHIYYICTGHIVGHWSAGWYHRTNTTLGW